MNRSLSKALALAALCGVGGILPSLSQGAAIPRAPAWWGGVAHSLPSTPVAWDRLHPGGPVRPAFVPPPSLAWRPPVRPAQRVQGYRFRPLPPAGRSPVPSPSAAPVSGRRPMRAAQRLQGYRFRPLAVPSEYGDRRPAGAPATAAPAPGYPRFARTLPAPWPRVDAFRFRPMTPPRQPMGWWRPAPASVAWMPGVRRYLPYGAPAFRPRMPRGNPYPVARWAPRAGILAAAASSAGVPQRPAPVFRFRPLAPTSPIVPGRAAVRSLASRPFSGPAVPGYRRTGPPSLPLMGRGISPVYRFRPLQQPTDRLAGRYRGVPAPVAAAGGRYRFPLATYRYRPDPRFARVPGRSIHGQPDGAMTAGAPGWPRSRLPQGQAGTAAVHERFGSERRRSRGRADRAMPVDRPAASPAVAQAEQGAAGMIRPWIAGPVSTE